MSGVHEVFHVSMLRKYTPDPAHVVDWGQIEVDTDGTFEEGPLCILDSRDKVLRRKTVRLVRVLCVDRTKTHIRIYDTITKGLLFNP